MTNGDAQTAPPQERERKKKDRKKERVVLALDADRLGMVVGALVATIVMAASFLLEVDAVGVTFRTGVAFIGAYAATFFFVRVVLRATLKELVLQDKKAGRKGLGRKGSAAAEKTEAAPTPEAPPVPSTEPLTQEETP